MTVGALARDRTEAPKLVREIVTPEGIPIRFQLARIGDRATAFLLDCVIQIGVLVGLGLGLRVATGGHTDSFLTAVIVIAAFLLLNFYFAFFEIRWQGSTPGKRRLGIRVIDARGGQLETGAVLARNLIRELEVWMPLRFLLAGRLVWPGAPAWAFLAAGAWTFVFMLMPLFNKDHLRVGDLIAGTRVVQQPRLVLVPDLVDEQAANAVAAPARPAFAFTEAQLGVYGIYELQVLEGVLRRSPAEVGYDEAIAAVSDKIRAKLGYTERVDYHERFLRDFYAALRAHLEQKLLFGQRREDKHAKP
jgi:uncharacterized RDD family membrane protein YckC